MKGEWLVSIVAICVLSVVVVLLSQVSYSQIKNCKSPSGSQPCTTNNNATFNDGQNTGCKAAFRYKQCNDVEKEAHLTCTNIGCKQDCSCSCSTNPMGMASSWLNICEEPNKVKFETESCRGCPTSQQACAEEGMYWNFTTNTCDTDPPVGCETQNCCEGFQECCTWDSSTCSCNCSPILVDVSGNGFSLTNATEGVPFDLNNDGVAGRVGWTKPGSDDAFLVLDRNGNQTIDSGSELFGGLTPQPASTHPNGFAALAEYDKSQNRGNGDGLISSNDAVFSSLRLWQDTNHNGRSEPSELHTLTDLGLKSLDLKYKEAKGVDEFGNIFRYRGKVEDIRDAQLGRWAWDVFLVKQ